MRKPWWEKIRAALVERVRTDAERNADPSYAIIDSQSVKTVSVAEERGIDGGKTNSLSEINTGLHNIKSILQ